MSCSASLRLPRWNGQLGHGCLLHRTRGTASSLCERIGAVAPLTASPDVDVPSSPSSSSSGSSSVAITQSTTASGSTHTPLIQVELSPIVVARRTAFSNADVGQHRTCQLRATAEVREAKAFR
jgi:hypothetical protein